MRRAVIGMLVLAMAAPSAAQAAGGPVGPMAGLGVQRPGDPSAYVALPYGRHTILQQLEGSRILRYRTLPGDYGIPGAAYDGSATGLSADGRTLVLAQFAASWNRTRLLPVDTHRYLRPLRPIVLAGFYTVDAISPDGSRLYLIHYRRPQRSVVDYEVRAYDLRARRLLPGAIVDPREPDEKMQGQPVTRLVSPDGRWAYTLYSRGPEKPFIHALDTSGRTAACVDLPLNANLDQVFEMRLRFGPGGALQVTHDGNALVDVNTKTFAVSQAAAQKPPPKPAAGRSDGGSQFPWALMALPAAAVLAGLGVLARRRRRYRSAPA